MAYRIEYMPEAFADIGAALTCLSRFYPNTAAAFSRILERKIKQLADQPNMAETWKYDAEFRKLIVDNYLAFYVVYEDSRIVEIHRVLRATWNLQQL